MGKRAVVEGGGRGMHVTARALVCSGGRGGEEVGCWERGEEEGWEVADT